MQVFVCNNILPPLSSNTKTICSTAKSTIVQPLVGRLLISSPLSLTSPQRPQTSRKPLHKAAVSITCRAHDFARGEFAVVINRGDFYLQVSHLHFSAVDSLPYVHSAFRPFAAVAVPIACHVRGVHAQ